MCLHYLLNQLQPLPFAQPVVVSLNPVRNINPRQIIGEYEYAHPVFDLGAIAAQQQVPALQKAQHTWFCGAWTGYGFHEDGLKSGLAVAPTGAAAASAPKAGRMTTEPRATTKAEPLPGFWPGAPPGCGRAGMRLPTARSF